MSHHVSASSTNPTGAVEVVHVRNSATTASPVDGGGGVARQSGTRGANLPVEDIEQASNTIQRGKADLAQTAGAERRLDGFDGVGGGGGGGGANGNGANANANNATGAPAKATKDLATEKLAQQRANGRQDLDPASVVRN